MLTTTLIGRGATVVAVALAATVLAACSGGEDPVTPEQAAAIAAAGLLVEEDLPSITWEVEDEDGDETPAGEGLDDPDDIFATTPSCQAFVEAIGEGQTAEERESLADVTRTFDNGGDSLVVRSVSSNVTVPDPETDLEGRFEAVRSLFTPDNMRACFEDGFQIGRAHV